MTWIDKKMDGEEQKSRHLTREQTNDGLRVLQVAPHSLPEGSLISSLPACRSASVMKHPAERGDFATHTKHRDR